MLIATNISCIVALWEAEIGGIKTLKGFQTPYSGRE